MKDPIAEDVCANRDELARECGYDLAVLRERERRFLAEWKGKKITDPFHPEWRAPKPSAAFVAEDRTEYARKDDEAGSTKA
jgi:hypothetical protein